ncbi:tRNA wybutosine-synthesizing protein 3 homolog [Styela clava]
MAEFSRWKAAALAKADLSRKGSIDSAIENVVHFINGQSGYFTTSSCSGRILLCSDDVTGDKKKDENNDEPRTNNTKKGCQWYFVSHEIVNPVDVIEHLKNIRGPSKLKFEPFVMHVQCNNIEAARCFHQASVASGFRNSGISLGKGGRKIISAVRGTACLEVPLTDIQGNRITDDKYVDYIIETANRKLHRNFEMIKVFESELKKTLPS